MVQSSSCFTAIVSICLELFYNAGIQDEIQEACRAGVRSAIAATNAARAVRSTDYAAGTVTPDLLLGFLEPAISTCKTANRFVPLPDEFRHKILAAVAVLQDIPQDLFSGRALKLRIEEAISFVLWDTVVRGRRDRIVAWWVIGISTSGISSRYLGKPSFLSIKTKD